MVNATSAKVGTQLSMRRVRYYCDKDIDYNEAWDSDGTVHKAYHSSRTVDIYS